MITFKREQERKETELQQEVQGYMKDYTQERNHWEQDREEWKAER